MIPVSLETVAAVTGGDLFIGSSMEPRPVTGVVRDSREVQPGDLFLCIPGERADGHDFAPKAYLAGASSRTPPARISWSRTCCEPSRSWPPGTVGS